MEHESSVMTDEEDGTWGLPMCLCLFIVLIGMAFFFRDDMLKIINPKTHLKTNWSWETFKI